MVLVSHKYKFIYIKNMKVAGSSVESLFGKYCTCNDYSYDDRKYSDINKDGIVGSRNHGDKFKWHGHLKASKIKEFLGDDKFNSYYKFCVVRNPWDALVSRYFYSLGRRKERNVNKKYYKIDFKTWVLKSFNIDFQNNWSIYSINEKPICDFYIKYENLNEDILKVAKKLNIIDFDITKLPNHKSQYRKDRKHYSSYYDDELIEIVEKKFKKEIDLFNYKFEYLK